ncbi:hypothetical protein EDC65_1576 [Stella humosa]|uniref:Sulphur transport domain-containing protein n=2 Tax=Stella humosa TaxID=94 RepID=A0A3N1M994_9PROT|nr:hypothetical protein EDC65_1576 [Stella humosa]
MGALLVHLAAGLLFGGGLAVSGMVDPAKVTNFLDVAGKWDPTLAFVMGAAVAVTFVGYRLAFARGRPLIADRFELPTQASIDGRLVGGAAVFGVGWGLIGFCPGPALTSLGLGSGGTWVFAIAMVAGMIAARCVPASAKRAR